MKAFIITMNGNGNRQSANVKKGDREVYEFTGSQVEQDKQTSVEQIEIIVILQFHV